MREARVPMPGMRREWARFLVFPARPCPAGGSWGSYSCENLRGFSTIFHYPAFFVYSLENPYVVAAGVARPIRVAVPKPVKYGPGILFS